MQEVKNGRVISAGIDLYTDKKLEDTIDLLLGGKKRRRPSSPNVENKRRNQAIYFLENSIGFNWDLKTVLNRLSFIHARNKNSEWYGRRTKSLMAGMEADWWSQSEKMNFAKVRLSTLVKILKIYGTKSISVQVWTGDDKIIKLSDVSKTFQDYKFSKRDRYLLRTTLSTVYNLKRVSFVNNFAQTPIISLMMFLKTMGYTKLVIDVEDSFNYYKSIGVYKEEKK